MAETRTPTTWAARIAAMPPIDWDALAAEEWANSGRTRKGDKRPVAEVMAMVDSRKRNQKAKAEAAADRAIAERIAAWHARRAGVPLMHRVLRAMAPGEWYGRRDMVRVSGLARDPLRGVVLKMRRLGLLERARNPDYRPQEQRAGEGVDQIPPERRNAPLWLYRLTAAGEAARAVVGYLG